jgi:NADH:quinone reductase (non-electrogenic)
MATIGRAAAVAADFVWLHFSGYAAWLAWLFTHLMCRVGHQNRFLVFVLWVGNYFTRNRSARLITAAIRLRNRDH